jgi:hypothetical protein
MFKRAITILLLLLSFGAIPLFSWAQQNGDSGARNIFDQGVGQNSDPGTEVRQRSQIPVRPKSKVSTSKAPLVRQSRSSRKMEPVALKYSVVLLGQENPKGYAGVRKLVKALPQEDGKYYGMADPDQYFRQGDVIRLAFEVSRPGYLYILSLETDGKRNLLYPDMGKSAYVTGDSPVMVGPLKIEPPAGTDKLTVLFSYERIKSFEEGSRDLAQDFEAEVKGRDYRAIEEEEVYVATRQRVALYFAAAGKDGLKAEIDIKHTN